MNPLIQFKKISLPLIIVTVLMCFALLPQTQAISPLPDGSYGNQNTAEGFDALFTFTGISPNNGAQNTAIGYKALFHNANGHQDTATGFGALFTNTAGFGNTANGFDALFNNNGNSNTAIGNNAMFKNKTGSFNTAVGDLALQNSTGGGNIALGEGAGFSVTTGANNIEIGNEGTASDNQTIRIGNIQSATFIAGIAGTDLSGDSNAQPVRIDTATFQLGIAPLVSSQRFKDDIKPMEETSEAILRLRPVTFQYKTDLKRTPQFGLVAEDVEKVNPDLITRDHDGKPYTVRYEAVNAMLLNEFLKEHRKVETLEATVAQQRKDFEAALAQLKEQVQKVSAQIELQKSSPQAVTNNQ